MPNRLAGEMSPYLRQHASNPVDWYPWGEEALERARTENKPILLSIGYAACHWCHVMAHESFEDAATAAVMNDNFVNIKVDREERPDLDSIYMQAVQAMTGQGGWPMTVFLTPGGEPFYGGTYFPPRDRHGLPSFTRVLSSVADAYRNRPDSVAASAASVGRIYRPPLTEAYDVGPNPDDDVTAAMLNEAYVAIARTYDPRNGGFGEAPKFPPTMVLEFLLQHWARTGGRAHEALSMAHETFIRMARGGIYDQIGGGFARYSVDASWSVPHFEKMLYDNALLIQFGAHLWQATKDSEVQRVVAETVEWVTREMMSPEGGFYSSLDADSEGEEGKFYVWSIAELRALLGEHADPLMSYWGATDSGNFEGGNILNVPLAAATVAAEYNLPPERFAELLKTSRELLYENRARRVWPARDGKIIAAWNGLMLRALAQAARIFGSRNWRALAVKNAEFLWGSLVRDDRVFRSYSNGVAGIPGFLEDHAAVALGFVAVYQLTFDRVWLDRARALAGTVGNLFWDDKTNQFFDTALDAERLITRPRDVTDNALPSGNSLAVELLQMLGSYSGGEELLARADRVIRSIAPAMIRYPQAFGRALTVADAVVYGAVEVALIGSNADGQLWALYYEVARHYVPSLILAGGKSEPGDGRDDIVLLNERAQLDGRATAFVCRGSTCELPTTEPSNIGPLLAAAARSTSISATSTA